AWVPLVIWALAALPDRAGAFRIAFGCAFVAGFARLTGYVVEGYPGVAPVVFMTLELAAMPMLLLWHARLVRLAGEHHADRGAATDAGRSAGFARHKGLAGSPRM